MADHRHWCRSYATQALRVTAEFTFAEGCRQLQIEMATDNEPWRASCKRLLLVYLCPTFVP